MRRGCDVTRSVGRSTNEVEGFPLILSGNDRTPVAIDGLIHSDPEVRMQTKSFPIAQKFTNNLNE